MKIETKTIPEYGIIKLPVAEMLGAYVAGKPVVKTIVFRRWLSNCGLAVPGASASSGMVSGIE